MLQSPGNRKATVKTWLCPIPTWKLNFNPERLCQEDSTLMFPCAVFVSRKIKVNPQNEQRITENMFLIVQLVFSYSHMLPPAGTTADARPNSVANMTQKVEVC